MRLATLLFLFMLFAALFAKNVPKWNLNVFMRKMCNLWVSSTLYKMRCFPIFGKMNVNLQKV